MGVGLTQAPSRSASKRALACLASPVLLALGACASQPGADPGASAVVAPDQRGAARPEPLNEVFLRASSATIADLPAPRQFVTRHETRIRGQRVRYTATAGETYITNTRGEPIASMFSFAYVKDGPPDLSRPVMFVFNGGPGSASFWLHMGVVGPRRLVLDQEVNPSNTPPFGVRDNPDSPLDAADIVFIDPVGTGFSRAVGEARNAEFFNVDADAESVARFIELWLTEHGRWNSPKYLMGESYGATRAAILPRALMGATFYTGIMRGITVNGVILVSPAMDAGAQASAASDGPNPDVGIPLASMAATAWYHNRIDRAGRTVEVLYDEVNAFGQSEYARAVYEFGQGRLSDAERDRIAQRLEAYTAIPASEWVASRLQIPMRDFRRRLLVEQGLEVGSYDSRYTLPLAGSGDDPVADDPAMGRYTPGFIAAFHDMIGNELGVDMDAPYNSIAFAEVNFAWSWARVTGASAHPAQDLAMAMRRTPALRVMVATGYFDMGSTPASAEEQLTHGIFPADRLTHRNYESGHVLYLGGTAETFANDVRQFILDGSPQP